MPQSREPDPLRELREIQEHQYDPGYYLGGDRESPILAHRPNRFAYVYFGVAVAVAAIMIWRLAAGDRDGGWWKVSAMVLVLVAYGFILLRRKSPRVRAHKWRRRR